MSESKMDNKYQQSSSIQLENNLYRIVEGSNRNFNEWLYLRNTLWLTASEENHREEMNSILNSDNQVAFITVDYMSMMTGYYK
ncbi:hypothetical protein [Photorhabdus sp. CRCIA-P01]|uniref:hypothetical protein n=1 Tax=Photorhabdus sp. CRCIA-P01 TaxID=2019570 RepID=UPI000E59F0CA|nr:hypothetical protein [Photorhabdus sp. CRCIA-P01]